MTISTTPTGRDFEIDRLRFVEGCSTRDVAAACWELVVVEDEAKVSADAAMYSPVGDCSPITADCSPNAGFIATERLANSVPEDSYDPFTDAMEYERREFFVPFHPRSTDRDKDCRR